MSDKQSVRRIQLPSGRTIEVVRFHDSSDDSHAGLHICPACTSEMVQPESWSEEGPDRWWLLLRCPNCGWCDEGVYSTELVQALEYELDEGLSDLLRDLQRFTEANMADEVARFCHALQHDHVLPEDF